MNKTKADSWAFSEAIKKIDVVRVQCDICEDLGIMHVADRSGEDYESVPCTYCPQGERVAMM